MSKAFDSPLRNLRRSRTLSQMDLARLAGVSQSLISAMERGDFQPRVDVQAKIAAILGVSRQDLFPSAEASS